jgi:hypothetical protein
MLRLQFDFTVLCKEFGGSFTYAVDMAAALIKYGAKATLYVNSVLDCGEYCSSVADCKRLTKDMQLLKASN